MSTSNRFITILLTGIIAFSGLILEARNINVRGTVMHDGTQDPIYGVSIYNKTTNKLIGTTNDEGRYTVNIPDDNELEFKVMGYEDASVKVNGYLNIDVYLVPLAQVLDEVVVQSTITKALITEPTDIEVKGNYLHVKTHVKIPHELFSSSMRMIIQPSIYNITSKQRTFMKPVVFDGQRYAITQERMYDWVPDKDPLLPYVQVKNTGHRKDDILTIRDSIYVENPNNDFRCDIMSSLENYNGIVYADTIMIARGTINPLRFLSYSIQGSPVTDENFFPSPEMQLRDTKGNVKLTFPVGKSKLIMELGDNRTEMDRLIAQLHDIENNPDMTLKSFSISGTASPEGNYDRNRQLAKARMESAMNVILQGLSPMTRRNVEVSSDADVASWSEVAVMMRSDGHDEEAQSIEDIIGRYPDNITAQSRKITALPIYKSLIRDEYLPRLRNVHYRFVTSRYRYLTDDEIKELYATNSSEMSRYEFWRLYNQSAEEDREAIIRRALEVHPKFIVGATDLAAILIDRDASDVSLLESLLATSKRDVPDESRLNQGIAYLNAGQYTRADSILSLTPDTERYHKARIYSAALNGRYMDVMQEVSEDSPINEVLLLLAIKADDQAWDKAQHLGGSAKEEYIKAIAANRTDHYIAASTHLENALKLDPSLREIAKVDGDVLDLLNDESENN